MAKASDFLSLDDKSKQRYKLKTNNMKEYDPYQIKKEELSGNISKFPPVQWRSQPIIVNYFLFSLSPLSKEGLKAYKSLDSYNQFASGWVKELKMKLFFNHLLKLPWLLDRSARNVFPSSLYCSIQIRCIVFIGSAKIPKREGRISSSRFYGQLPHY